MGKGLLKRLSEEEFCSLCLTICDKVYIEYRYSNRGCKSLFMLIQRHQAYIRLWNQKAAQKKHVFVFCMLT